MKADSRFTKSSFARISHEALDFQLRALYPVEEGSDPERVYLVFLNHDRNFSTFLTIKDLVERERVADIYSLSRAMFESVITMGLLAAHLIPEDVERYQQFQFVEISRRYEHMKRLGLQYLTGVSAEDGDLVSAKRKEYAFRWGNRMSSWSGNSFEKDVRLVDRAYRPACDEPHFYEYLYCQVYRTGSQSVHASFAGLAKGVQAEGVELGGLNISRFKPSEKHLIFSAFHSLLVFLSSVRFLGHLTGNAAAEEYFHRMTNHVISED